MQSSSRSIRNTGENQCANITIADVTKMGDVNIRLRGWFESYRYFEAINSVIRSEFTFKDNIKASVSRFFKSHIFDKYSKNITTIGIHIRQGDMESGMLCEKGLDIATDFLLQQSHGLFPR